MDFIRLENTLFDLEKVQYIRVDNEMTYIDIGFDGGTCTSVAHINLSDCIFDIEAVEDHLESKEFNECCGDDYCEGGEEEKEEACEKMRQAISLADMLTRLSEMKLELTMASEKLIK
jgi:hypothetical protein